MFKVFPKKLTWKALIIFYQCIIVSKSNHLVYFPQVEVRNSNFPFVTVCTIICTGSHFCNDFKQVPDYERKDEGINSKQNWHWFFIFEPIWNECEELIWIQTSSSSLPFSFKCRIAYLFLALLRSMAVRE